MPNALLFLLSCAINEDMAIKRTIPLLSLLGDKRGIAHLGRTGFTKDWVLISNYYGLSNTVSSE